MPHVLIAVTVELPDKPGSPQPHLPHVTSLKNLRNWVKSAREATVICNQAASFNRCLFKVQQGMQTQIKAIWTES